MKVDTVTIFVSHLIKFAYSRCNGRTWALSTVAIYERENPLSPTAP